MYLSAPLFIVAKRKLLFRCLIAGQRAVAKANSLYRNSAWDLSDALKEGKVDLAKIKSEDLPENMRKMTLVERNAYIQKTQDQREAIQKKINTLNAERVKFVAAKQKELAEKNGQDTLDLALIKAIRDQATKKKFSFGDELAASGSG